MDASNFKIVPRVEKPASVKISDLLSYLAANVDVAMTDNDFEKAAMFQQHLDLVELLVEKSQGRI